MANAFDSYYGSWTTGDVIARFGDIPFVRVRQHPLPGTATEQDVIAVREHEDRLCELVDGVLVEKAMGYYESLLAMLLVGYLREFNQRHNLGLLAGPDGMTRLAAGLVRIPDISFVLWERLPERKVPHTAFLPVAPDLAVEIISQGNTPEEMTRKLHDYFAAGVRLVWYIYPASREVYVYTSPQAATILGEHQILEGGEVLPGFTLELKKYFAEPQPNPAAE